VPAAERGLAATLVVAGRERFLIDCGEGTTRQLVRGRVGFRHLRTVLLTHLHFDHLGGLPGLVATRELYRQTGPIEIIGSEETIAFARRFLEAAVGAEGEGCPYRLRVATPGRILTRDGFRVEAFPVAHRGTQSLGYLFARPPRRPLDPDRLAALGIPDRPARRALGHGERVVLEDGRKIEPEMVLGPESAGCKVALVGDSEETASLARSVADADALVIEATFLERDQALARARGHLCAAEAARLAAEAGVGRLLLTHISQRYPAAEIAAEAQRIFPNVKVVADFDRFVVGPRASGKD
jgi:ribonuclease Z